MFDDYDRPETRYGRLVEGLMAGAMVIAAILLFVVFAWSRMSIWGWR